MSDYDAAWMQRMRRKAKRQGYRIKSLPDGGYLLIDEEGLVAGDASGPVQLEAMLETPTGT